MIMEKIKYNRELTPILIRYVYEAFHQYFENSGHPTGEDYHAAVFENQNVFVWDWEADEAMDDLCRHPNSKYHVLWLVRKLVEYLDVDIKQGGFDPTDSAEIANTLVSMFGKALIHMAKPEAVLSNKDMSMTTRELELAYASIASFVERHPLWWVNADDHV